MNPVYKNIPSKSILCSDEVSGEGPLFSRKYLYDGANLPSLESPTLVELEDSINLMHKCHLDATWRDTTSSNKVQIIRKSADLLESNASIFATYDAIETGRSFKSLLNDSIPKAVQTIRWFCSAFEVLRQHSYETGNSTDIAYTKNISYGICLCILPWNDPLVLFAWKVIPALLMGNPVIVKPSEYSSGSALLYAKLLYQSGLPKNALSVVVGRDSVTFEYLVTSVKIPVVSMTGSTKTALYIQQLVANAGVLKKLNFECGGKSPFLISNQNSLVNIEKACQVLVKNMFYNQGQICSAPSLLICDSTISQKVIDLILHYAKSWIPGDPFSDENKVGTMCIESSVKSLKEYIDNARSLGAKVLQLDFGQKSNQLVSLPPTILLVDKSLYLNNKSLRQELFGPILTVVVSSSFEEMIELGNSSEYGLASALWSESLREIQRASLNLEAGVLHINSYGDDGLGIPFGGIKNSGDAKEKSIETFEQFSYSKTIYISIN